MLSFEAIVLPRSAFFQFPHKAVLREQHLAPSKTQDQYTESAGPQSHSMSRVQCSENEYSQNDIVFHTIQL